MRTAIESDAPLVQMDIETEHVQDTGNDRFSKDAPPTFRLANALWMFGPVSVTTETKWLKVYVDTGDETLESLKLRLQSVTAFAQPTEGPAPSLKKN